VDGEPARGTVAGSAPQPDRLGLASDLEGELAVEDVEGVGVPVMDVGAGDLLPGRGASVRA
jgi:hypothetical protein